MGFAVVALIFLGVAAGCSDDSGDDAEAAIARCVGNETAAVRVDAVEGDTERAARAFAHDERWTIRIIGRGSRCMDRTDDLRPDRLNLFVQDGVVVWAGRF